MSSDVVGVAIAVSASGYAIMQKILFENPIASPDSTEYLLSCEWEFEGLDVADANGYFSLFYIDSGAQKLGSGGRFFQIKNETATKCLLIKLSIHHWFQISQ